VALTGIIGVSAAQAHRGPDQPGRGGCPAAHSHHRGQAHGRGHSRAHARCSETPPTFDEVTTTIQGSTTTSEDTSTTQVG